VWVLAPTAMLCTQQYDYLRSFLPAARTRLLIGAENVDRWSEQRIWDAMLEEIQIDVSTHALFADALSHTFVKMSRLALIVFDEGIYFKPFQHSSAADS
jgi:RecG-like helicase